MNASPEADMPVSAVYMIRTRPEIIVKLEKNCDKYQYLGAHLWRDFLVSPSREDLGSMSVMYEYKYENMGSPEKRSSSFHV
jgi:hypothetical protein